MSNQSNSLPKEVGFRVSPRTMQMLGRENISSPVIAVLELVKNAYDADATHVVVRFRGASTESGYIEIEDDGEGMDLADLVDKLMVISTDNKVHNPRTKKGRIKAGEKGIGRLAMNRLGNKAIITTHRLNGGQGLRLELDWNKYDADTGDLQDIKHPLFPIEIERPVLSGTILHLENLRDSWTVRDYEKLHDDLALLVPPFAQSLVDFSIDFDCDEAPNLFGPVSNPAVEAAEYKLESTLTVDGQIHHKLIHRSGETKEYNRLWDKAFDKMPPGTQPLCGPLQLTIFYYLDDSEYLKKIGVNRAKLRKFLDQFQGIRIYRDNFRVKPYGDPGTDWLGLNLRKVKSNVGVGSTGYKVSQNQVVGSIFISRHHNQNLQDQTNREGLVNNQAYLDMQKFALNGMQFLETERHLRFRRENPKTNPLEPIEVLNKSSVELEGLKTVTVELRDTVNKINPPLFEDNATRQFRERASELVMQVQQMTQQVSTQIQSVQATYKEQQTERQLLLGLATLGIAMTTFGHETMRAVNNLLNRAKFLKNTIKHLPPEFQTTAENDLQVLTEAARKIKTWGEFALDRIRLDKRTQKDIDFNQVIEDVLMAFSGEMTRSNIQSDPKLAANIPRLKAFAMDIEAILINFITNAVEAMRYTPLDDRAIKIESDYNSETKEILLRFADSGRGIESEDIDKIFDPLFSTKVDDKTGKPIGTGMGLTIIKSIVEDHYLGRIDVVGRGELGGAEFSVYFPDHIGRNSNE